MSKTTVGIQVARYDGHVKVYLANEEGRVHVPGYGSVSTDDHPALLSLVQARNLMSPSYYLKVVEVTITPLPVPELTPTKPGFYRSSSWADAGNIRALAYHLSPEGGWRIIWPSGEVEEREPKSYELPLIRMVAD